MPTTFNLAYNDAFSLGDSPGQVLPPASLSDALTLADTPDARVVPIFRGADTIQFSGDATAELVNALRDALDFGDAPAGVLDYVAALGDSVTFGDTARIAYAVAVSETISIGDDLVAWRAMICELVDTLSLAAGVQSTWDASVAVASVLVFGDSIANVLVAQMVDTVEFSAIQSAAVTATVGILDGFRIDAATSPSLQMCGLLSDAIALDDTLTLSQNLVAKLNDGIEFLAQLSFDNHTYLAWVLNPESKAFSSYSNYPFNSFATLGDRTLAAKADGIYALGGEDDAGTQIDAFIRSGLTDFGSSKLKRMPSLYLGYRTDGRLLLKVTVVDDDGNRQEHWYDVEDRPAAAMRTGRVKPGKGLVSTYWGFELANVQGADLDLDKISWSPMVLDRRL